MPKTEKRLTETIKFLVTSAQLEYFLEQCDLTGLSLKEWILRKIYPSEKIIAIKQKQLEQEKQQVKQEKRIKKENKFTNPEELWKNHPEYKTWMQKPGELQHILRKKGLA